MAYIDRLLQPGERVLVRARLHGILYLRPVALLVLAGAVALIAWLWLPHARAALGLYAVAGLFAAVGLFDLLARMTLRATTEFGVTSIRVIVKRGILSLHTIEMSLDKIESVDVDQSLIGRLFGYGAVVIHGVGSRWDPIVGIEHPLAFRTAITTRGGPVAAA